MTNLAEQVGWYLFLLFLMAVATLLVKGLMKMVCDEAAQGNVVDTTDALIALVLIVAKLAKSNWHATVCTVAVYLSMLGLASLSVYASLGYSVTAFAVTGFLTPLLKRRLKFSAETSAPQVSPPEQSTDSNS